MNFFLSPSVLMHCGLLCIALRLSVCPSVCDWTEIHLTIIHISKTVAVRGMKFDQNMHVGDPKDDLEGQGHRSTVRVTRSKNAIFRSHLTALQVMFGVKGHIGQGQKSCWSRWKVTWVKVSQKVIILEVGLTSMSSCIFFFWITMNLKMLANWIEFHFPFGKGDGQLIFRSSGLSRANFEESGRRWN